MITDDVVWQVINYNQCSFKAKTQTQTMCRNKYNLTGTCNKASCPLANSQYATILEEDGMLFLCMKTAERAHMPKNLWERVKLPKNYMRALETIDANLQYWPKFVVHKCKQRLTKITQYLIRMRRLRLKAQPKLERVHKKREKRDARREVKAERAANLDRAIEKELLDRLRAGTYGDIYNFPQREYAKMLDKEEVAEDQEEEEGLGEEDGRDDGSIEFVEDLEDEDDEEDLEDGDRRFDEVDVNDGEEGAADGGGDDDRRVADSRSAKRRKKTPVAKKRPHVGIEYERELELEQTDRIRGWR